jgi:hypothetical protein
MATWRYVAYDLQKSLKKTFDDSDLTFPQIVYWVMVVANKLRVQHYLSTNTDLFTSTYSAVPVQKDGKGRKYIDLPTQMIDLPFQKGIKYISYNIDQDTEEYGYSFAQVFFQPTFTGQVQHLYLDDYTRPSRTNPYFYRIGQDVDGVSVDRLYLLGVETLPIEDVEVAMLSTLNPNHLPNLDDEIPLPDELILDLMTQILNLGRMILMIPEERKNDGSDDTRVGNLPNPQMQQQQQQAE